MRSLPWPSTCRAGDRARQLDRSRLAPDRQVAGDRDAVAVPLDAAGDEAQLGELLGVEEVRRLQMSGDFSSSTWMLPTLAVPARRPSASWTSNLPILPLKVSTVLCLTANPMLE